MKENCAYEEGQKEVPLEKDVKNLGPGVIRFIGNALLRSLVNQARACSFHVSEELALKGGASVSSRSSLSTQAQNMLCREANG